MSTVTMADVARRAGVTKQTVSNVVTGKAVVSERTRQRVLTVIEELGYRPNLVARGLARGKTFILGCIVPTIANPFYAEVVEEVERLAEEQNYHLILCTTLNEGARGKRHLEVLTSRSIDGLLISGDRYLAQHPSAVMHRDFPVVLCAWESESYPDTLPVVTIDYLHAGQLAGQHLLDLGHQHVAVIFEHASHLLRLRGFRAALTARGMNLPDDYIAAGDSSFESGYRAAQQLMTRIPRPTAIFATNDLMALGVLEALNDADLRVPEDVSIVGLDDIPQGVRARPPLTTVALPKREMAKESTELLLRCIERADQPRLVTLLRPQLIVRRSTIARDTLS